MTKLNQESGRSMVEMLGVLAIIGVLSIGGIAGYTMAMNRFRANSVINAAQLLSVAGIAASSTNAADPTLVQLGIRADELACTVALGTEVEGVGYPITVNCPATATGVVEAINAISGVNVGTATATTFINADGSLNKTTTTPEEGGDQD